MIVMVQLECQKRNEDDGMGREKRDERLKMDESAKKVKE
jgi:hypothetical protein